MKVGSGAAALTETKELERTSLRASTMFMTGSVPVVAGSRGLETKALNFSPLLEPVLELLLLELLQENSNKHVAKRLKKDNPFFKRKAPRRMKDRGLDARSGIITEALTLSRARRAHTSLSKCKTSTHLVFSKYASGFS